MKLVGIKVAEYRGRPSPIWKKDRPYSLVLVASNGGASVVLTHIGPDVELIEEGEPIGQWVNDTDLEPGIWVLKIHAEVVRCDSIDYGTDYDLEAEVVVSRPATDAEVEAHAQDEWPWDPELWMENWPEVRDWRTPTTEIKEKDNG